MPTSQSQPRILTPPNVVAFSAEHDLDNYLASACELALRVFPSVQALEARVQSDPDIPQERIIIDVTVAADIADVLAAKRTYTREWMRSCPAGIRDMIRLLYHMA